MDEQIEVVDVIDYTYFVKNRLLPEVKSKVEKVMQLCTFLKVSDLQILKRRDLLASFRTTVTSVTDKNVINANVWLQTALNKGLAMKVAPFDEKKLKAHIKEIRSMTLQEPNEFLPRLCEIFNECGVAFVLLPALKNCGINGVVKWYDDKVVLALNDRFKYADAFWFSLFHEIKHVFQKKKTKVIINCNDDLLELDEEFEKEADDFATETLIPKDDYNSYFDDKGRYISKGDVERFAKYVGIHPGIVVGRLQHDKRIAHSSMMDLRQKYTIVL
jgi:HTH-type transcriptional regulator/antitoxin HigA